MNIRTLCRKSISIILCISILVSLIVMGTFSSNAEAVAGTYSFRVKWQCTNGGNSYKTGYSYDGNLTDNGKNYVGFTVLYKDVNGTGEEFHVDKDLGGSMKDKNDGKWEEWTNVGFPTGIFSHNDHGNALASGELKITELQVKKNGAADSAYTTVWSGTLRTKSNINIMEAWFNADGSKGTNGGDAEASGSAWTSSFPKPNSINFTTVPSNTTVTAPRMGEASKTLQYEATVYDQYGVTWYQPPVYSFTSTLEGVSIASSSGLVTVSSDAHSEDATDTTLTIKAVLTNKTGTSSIKVVNAKYNYEFKDLNGNTIPNASGSLKYGSVVPLPDEPVKPCEAAQHYNFSKWNANDPNWDGNTGRLHMDTVFTPEFTPENHIFLHYYSDENATCTQDGTKTATCTNKNCTITDTMVDKGSRLPHSYDEVTTPATCEEDGRITYTCSGCGDTYFETIPAKGHNHKYQEHPSTCTEQGYYGYFCENCGDSYGVVYTDPLGHNWDDGVVTTEPTCEATGEELFTCSRCHSTKTETLPIVDHDVRNWVLESIADCTTQGYKHGICKLCHNNIEIYTDPLGHDYNDWIIDVQPTCDTDGSKHRVCQREGCGHVDYAPIETLGHDYNLITTDPTDCLTGKLYYQCNTCSKYFTCVVHEDGTKEPGESGTKSEVVRNTAIVPTVEFNTYNRTESNYNYNTRGASLKIDNSADPNKQGIRFCASILLPQGATVLEYGYLHSLVSLSNRKFIRGGANVTEVPLTDGNRSTFITSKGTVYTFNLVINMDKEHWDDEIYSRPYIVYKYAGETFTVYDDFPTSRSVKGIAQQVIASPYERESTKEFFNAKIFGK